MTVLSHRDENPVDVEFIDVTKNFGPLRAVDGISFSVRRGEFLALLGPSGCGKTTCLRMIAGFEEPDSGTILIAGKNSRQVPPGKRPVNTVFQNYALFGHMNVRRNVEFGLKQHGVSKTERRERAMAALDMVRLADRAEQMPRQLSGGQQQRVALARALVLEPQVLLLDEPLAALDLQLRKGMQDELRRLHRDLGITFIFVTHDQGEAMSMADRIAVMNHGRIEQLASPEKVYQEPSTPFVAGFIGDMNVIPGELLPSGRVITQSLGALEPTSLRHTSPGPVTVGIRPDGLQITSGNTGVTATIIDRVLVGEMCRFLLQLADGQEIIVKRPRAEWSTLLAIPDGAIVELRWADQDLLVLRDPAEVSS